MGDSILYFNALPYTPSPILLGARTGDIKIVVNMPMHMACATQGTAAHRQIQVSLRVFTTAGLYVTRQVPVIVTS